MKKVAKEKFENNLDNFLLSNSSNPKMYWKIMKMLIKSNKGNYCTPFPMGYMHLRFEGKCLKILHTYHLHHQNYEVFHSNLYQLASD
jgi:hypothetical protein